MNILNSYLTQVILLLMLALAGWLGVQAKNLYKKYVTTEIKQAVCRTVVRTVEQLYKDLHGEQKLRKAMGRASKILEEYGIQISEYELVSMIEAAVNEFNNNFNKTETAALPELPGVRKSVRKIAAYLCSTLLNCGFPSEENRNFREDKKR